VKRVLAEADIDGFLAHEDLEVSDVWRERILQELRHCDLFVPLLSKKFLSSLWAPQETGFIISRPDVVIAPLSIDGTTPSGFISHLQSRRIPDEGASQELLIAPLAKRVPRLILPGLIRIVSLSVTFRSAEAGMLPLLPHFQELTLQEAQALAEASTENNQIWSASLCRRKYLPKFIEAQKSNIRPRTLRVLRYQIEHDESYPGDDE